MEGLPFLPDGTSQYDFRKPSLVPRIKLEDDVSPKSVIVDTRFISPASSSSSSMDHRPLSDANHVKLQQPRHDRGYSISDGESSDTDTLLESSRELNKIGATSRSLETLPETHSLALKATRTNIYKREGSSNGRLHETTPLPPTIQDKYQIQYSTRSHQKSTASDHSSAQDIMSISSRDGHTGSEFSRLNIQTRVSSQSTCALNRCDQGASTVRSPQLGIMHTFENPGTPLRFFPGWQSQLGSPGESHASFGSPGFEKGIGSYSPASLADQLSKGSPFQHRFLSGPLHSGIKTRPPPSKWDDAEKWIASPGHHEPSAQPQLQRPLQALPTGRRHSISGHCNPLNVGGGSPDFATPNAVEKPFSSTAEQVARSVESLNRSASSKQRSKALSFGDLSKRVFDLSCSNASPAAVEKSSENVGREHCHEVESKGVSDVDARQESRSHEPATQTRECRISESLEDANPETPENAGCLDNSPDMEVLKHSLTESTKDIGSHQLQSSSTADQPPPSKDSWRFGIRKSSSEFPNKSSCTTPAFTASPARHNTPAAQSGRRAASFGSIAKAGAIELQTWHLEKLELCKLSSDEKNVAWNTREEEEMECSVSLRDHDSGVLEKGCEDDETAALGGAKQTKHNERGDKEATRINAWEELQISRAEAEMQKLEMKIEKMRSRALDKMANRIALARKKAKEMRASAHTTRSEQAAKTVQQVEPSRISGHDVSPIARSFICCFKA